MEGENIMFIKKNDHTIHMKKTALEKETDLWRGNIVEFRIPFQTEEELWTSEIHVGKIEKRFVSSKAGQFVQYEILSKTNKKRYLIRRYQVSKLISREEVEERLS